MEVNRRHFLGAAALVVDAGFPGASSAHASQSAGRAKGDRRALKAIEAYMADHREAWGIPGMTLAVVSRDRFTGFVQSGLADIDKKIEVEPHHLFQNGTISKLFTALAA
jgi:CubicO group peptidase (beta-lactamase class C family)